MTSQADDNAQFPLRLPQNGSVNLIADERYNPLKSSAKEGSIK